jgi:molybdopterin-guanine dinucleotide biosynthesis protein A
MALSPTCSAVILTGGLNTRMQGRNKAFIQLGGRRFLTRVLDTVSAYLDDCLIVTRQTGLYREWPVKIVADRLAARSPLTGIHAGLLSMRSEFALVTSCDTPFLKKAVVKRLLTALEPDADVIVPASGTFFQPLCALYSRRCGPVIEEILGQGEVKVDRLYARVRVKRVAYRHFEAVDPELHSFFNVNTPGDLETARELWKKIAGQTEHL